MPPKRKLSPAAASPLPAAVPLLADDAAFASAVAAFVEHDAAFAAVMRAAGAEPRLRRRAPGFAGLAAIVVAQQVSTASADAIFGRVAARFPTLDADAVASATDEELRLCGLSAGKVRTLRAIAAAVAAGDLDFAALERAEAGAAHASLCAIKGVGPWTADIFLLFCLGHGDAWPAGDLALQEGARLALGLAERPDVKALHALGERWRPYRGVVAHWLWAYYGATRGRAGTLQGAEPAGKETPSMTKAPARRGKSA